MDNHTFIGKRKIGSTDLQDFTDYQGIGRDPLYKRYENVVGIVNREISPKYSHFLAVPDYVPDDDMINWYIDNWKEHPQRLEDLSGSKLEKYRKILQETVAHYRESLNRLSGEDLRILAGTLRYIDESFVFCADGKVFLLAWGMTADPERYVSKGLLVHGAPELIKRQITFNAGEHGSFSSGKELTVTIPDGDLISEKELPKVSVENGYEFKGWKPNPIGVKVNAKMSFTAMYAEAEKPPMVPPPPVPPIPEEELPKTFVVHFDAGHDGVLNGPDSITKLAGDTIVPPDIPMVTANKGLEFAGWNVNPLGMVVNGDMTFTALYNQKLPWYKQHWSWLRWLLLALLLLLLALILFGLLRGCRHSHVMIDGGPEINGVITPPRMINDRGDTIDYFGYAKPIPITDGRLPDDVFIAAPVRDEHGILPPVDSVPNMPPNIANRLILFLEDDNASVDALADDFKKAYPGEQYSVIGFDRNVKSLVIQIPENERDEIRNTINSKIPNQKFMVFDEDLYELNAYGPTQAQEAVPGWHLAAVRAPEAWTITQGSPEVKVAVIDDGIQASHPMFKGRITAAYNVYTQNNNLGYGDGHGTHTAALAVGSLQYLNNGAAGIAPECMLIPVQVIDGGMCPLSALISGIMYAIHQDADVINVSIGPKFRGLNALPPEAQEEIAATKFKNVQTMWTRVNSLAAAKNSIIVYAAGNDDIISAIPPENRSNSAIVVGAVNQMLHPTDFTNYGPCTDLSAPGSQIYSAYPTDQFRMLDGTSMAAPIVSGGVALLKSLKKDLTVEQARNVLYNTGVPVYGNLPPMVQFNLALEAVRRGDFSGPVAKPSLGSVPIESILPGEEAGGSFTVIPGMGTILPGGGGYVGVPIDDDEAGVIVGTLPGGGTVPGTGVGTTPGNGAVPPGALGPTPGYQDNSAEIRRLIEMYRQKIKDLESQLPENNNK